VFVCESAFVCVYILGAVRYGGIQCPNSGLTKALTPYIYIYIYNICDIYICICVHVCVCLSLSLLTVQYGKRISRACEM